MKKRNIPKIAAAICILLIAVTSLFFVAKTVKAENLKKAFAEQISLGERYLLEQKYEEAIIAFNLAIEIDPKSVDSYLKLSEAYSGIGDYESAASALEKGYELTQDSRLAEAMEKYRFLAGYGEVLSHLTDLMAQSDRNAVWDYQKGNEYQELAGSIEDVVRYPVGDNRYLLVYPCGHCYYGTMEDGKRSGYGIWSAYDYADQSSTYFEGEWSEDYPNGAGKSWLMDISNPEDLFYKEGTWVNGLENGRIDAIDYVGSEIEDPYFYTTVKGVPDEVVEPEPYLREYEDGIERYCIYYDDEVSVYTKVGWIDRVDHAGKGVDDIDSMTYKAADGGE